MNSTIISAVGGYVLKMRLHHDHVKCHVRRAAYKLVSEIHEVK